MNNNQENKKNIFIKIFLYLNIIFVNQPSFGEIITTYSVTSPTLKTITDWIDNDTMVIINLEDTLLVPRSLMFSNNGNPYRSFINDLVNLNRQNGFYTQAITEWYLQRKIKLVEKEWVDFINKIKSKGAQVYGICSVPIEIQNIEQKIYTETANLRILFKDNINSQETFEIAREKTWQSIFYRGIIFTGPYTKLQTIVNFIKLPNISAKKLIIIGNDDFEMSVIDRGLKSIDMDYYIITYLGIEKIGGLPKFEMVNLQQKELIEHGKWLEDEEASERLTILAK